jgi:outer membrane protein TolC
VVLFLYAPRASAQEPVLTLAEAVRLAVQGNRNLQIARLDVRRSQELAGATRAQMWPSVDVTVQRSQILKPLEFPIRQGALGTYPGVGPIPGQDTLLASVSGGNTRYSVGVSQTVVGLYKLGLAAEVQDREAEAARQGARSRASDLAGQVRGLYYTLLDTQNALVAARESLAFHQEFERLVAEYVAQGTGLPADLLEVQTALARDRQTVLALENGLRSQREQMNFLLGRSLDTPFRVVEPEVAPAPGQELSELLQEALSRRPEVLAAEVRLQQARTARELARSDYLPDVGLRLSYERQSNSGLLPPDLWMLTVQAQYDLLDGGRRDHQIAEKDLALEQAARNLEEARAQVELELRAQLRRLADLAQAVEAARLARQAAEEKLRVALARYQMNTALGREVLEAQAGLAQAQRDYQKTLLDQAAARDELDRILGRDP